MLAAVVPGAVLGSAAWAAVADHKAGWAVATAAVSGLVGSFGPTVHEWRSAWLNERRQQQLQLADVDMADLPDSVSWLLHPEKSVIDFAGRSSELRSLETWLTDEVAPVVRLVTADGGVGKSRLARQFARVTARNHGWAYKAIRPEAEARTARMIAENTVPSQTLLIVDYAETREPADLADMLCAAHRAGQWDVRIRILLLARTDGEWWKELSAAFPPQDRLVDALTKNPANVTVLPPNFDGLTPKEIIARTAAQFADVLGRQVPWQVFYGMDDPPPDTPMLMLQAEALVVVLGRRHVKLQDVLTEVLTHEARYWRGAARRAGLISDRNLKFDTVLRQVVGLAALFGVAGGAETEGIVARAPLVGEMTGPDEVGRLTGWLTGLYPSDGEPGALGTIQPSLLAEALAVDVLRSCEEEQQIRIFTGLSDEQATQSLTVLGRASAHEPEALHLMKTAIEADPERMHSALSRVVPALPAGTAAELVRQLSGSGFRPALSATGADATATSSEQSSENVTPPSQTDRSTDEGGTTLGR